MPRTRHFPLVLAKDLQTLPQEYHPPHVIEDVPKNQEDEELCPEHTDND